MFQQPVQVRGPCTARFVAEVGHLAASNEHARCHDVSMITAACFREKKIGYSTMFVSDVSAMPDGSLRSTAELRIHISGVDHDDVMTTVSKAFQMEPQAGATTG